MLEIHLKQKNNNKNTVVKLVAPKHQQWSVNLMQSTNCYKGLPQAVKKHIRLSINQDYHINTEAVGKTTGTCCACYRTGKLKHRSDLLTIITKAKTEMGIKPWFLRSQVSNLIIKANNVRMPTSEIAS